MPGVVVVLCERMGEYRVDRVVYPVGDLVSYCRITCLWANCRINFSHIVSSLLAAVFCISPILRRLWGGRMGPTQKTAEKRLHSYVF